MRKFVGHHVDGRGVGGISAGGGAAAEDDEPRTIVVIGDLAVAATGIGEAITQALLSYRVHERIRDGNDLSTDALAATMKWGINTLIAPEKQVGIIALGPEGEGAGVANTDMPWATWCEES